MRNQVQRVVLVVLALLVGAAPAAAATKRTTGCRAGQVPKKATKKVVCRTFALPKGARPATAPRSAQGELAQLTDQLQTALELTPKARARMDRRLGRKRTDEVVALALEGWQRRAGIAAATESTTQSFGSAGAGGTAKLEIGAYDDGRTGWHVAAEAEVELTREGLGRLGAGDDLPSGIAGGKAKVKLTFADVLAACPTAAGTVAGRLEASGSLSIDVKTKDGTVSVDLSASAAMTYIVKVGDDGKWYEISDTTMNTRFTAGGTGQKARSYYGNVSGDGYGTSPILGASGAAATRSAIERDVAIGVQGGSGVKGPSGSWSTKAGKEKVDVLSLLDYQSMMAAYVATHLINVAAIEYLRAIALPRGQKHWYDEEACLTVDGTAAPAQLKPSEVATVSVGNAKAKDGGAVSGSLTATGVASIAPGAQPLAAGATGTFRLTAPAQKGANATWQVVMVSRAGRKTVSGAIPVKADELPARFSGTVRGHDTTSPNTSEATWDGTATFTRTAQQDNPDGSRTGLYALSAVRLAIDDRVTIPLCATYAWKGESTTVVGGDLELQVAPDGTATAAFTLDVTFGEPTHVATGPVPMGCPGSTTGGQVKVVFNSRNRANALRPTLPDYALSMPDMTDDLATNAASGGFAHTSAGWTLSPGG